MHGDTLFKINSLIILWTGLTLFVVGGQKMYDSGYRPPETPPGWAMGIFWIVSGGILASIWISYISAYLLEQKCFNKPRWSVAKILSSSLILFGAASLAVVGTFLTWKHPYRLGPCDCLDTEWGPNCDPCECVNGICDSGTYGSGRCSCDLGWAGNRCDECDERWKGEDCNICKTGFTGDKCELCARGYDGENCDICAPGWQPWEHSSSLFPDTISSDDFRHLCDECLPNHWGYLCQQCPWGNDVPKITLDKNIPIQKGTRVADSSGNGGSVVNMQILKDDTWQTTYHYDTANPKILEHTRVKIKYDKDNTISQWLLFSDLRGVQCNNRGTCNDDIKHQMDNPNWQDTCTSTFQECTSNKDCTVSENCKGTCQPTELPVAASWVVQLPQGKLCSTDEDCIDRSIIIDATNATYEGGRCLSRTCCEESFHGDGTCDCDPQWFGPILDNGVKPLYELSPACDFCPGYDWLTEEPSTICSGGKGTCTPSYSRTNDYLQMRCTCGLTQYEDPITKIVDTERLVAWSGDLCECGDWNNDQQCDTCASGYWGPECTQCPGGFGLRACSGHGTCQGSGTAAGTGQCICDIKPETAWMLAPYVKRYESETVGKDVNDKDLTCSECAPNYWGEQCSRCDELQDIAPSQLNDIFQPGGSYSLGIGQSSKDPYPVCHPQDPTICSLACGGGGWCNWGRTGDGTCTCWSNKRKNDHTWNPLDNVCIGNQRFNGTSGEQCPSYGYCSLGDTSRRTEDLCGQETYIGTQKDMSQTIAESGWTPYDDWSGPNSDYNQECADQNKGQCYKWLPDNWRPRNWGFSCIRDE